MNQAVFLACAGAFALLMVVSAFMLLRQMRVQERFAARVRLAHGQYVVPTAKDKRSFRDTAMSGLEAVGQYILRSGVLSAKTRNELEQTLTAAGLHGSNGLAIYVGVKILLALGLPLIVLTLTRNAELSDTFKIFLPVGAGAIGLLAPEWLIGRRRKQYQKRLEAGLPDALDMMVICAQAGLGFGSVVLRVAAELQNAHWEVAHELAQTANELQMVSDSRVALTNLGSRTGIDGYKRLGVTLIQTMQYGTPLTDALRVLSAEMRQEALSTFETRAARLPVLLTMPTILFILPCVFIIAGGPAILQIIRAFN